jgi:coproporphyrinogen III oxidase-like Fe-S oxidoreductase
MSVVATETGEANLRRAIEDSNQDPIPRSIVLHVRFGEQGTEAFLQRLYREMEIYAPLLARDREVVHFTLEGDGFVELNAAQRAELLRSFEQYFALARTLSLPPGSRGSPPVEQAPADCDVLGLGLGAVTRFGSCRTSNALDFKTYSSALDAGHLPIVDCHWDDPMS